MLIVSSWLLVWWCLAWCLALVCLFDLCFWFWWFAGLVVYCCFWLLCDCGLLIVFVCYIGYLVIWFAAVCLLFDCVALWWYAVVCCGWGLGVLIFGALVVCFS